MPRQGKPRETPAKMEQNRLMWATYGKKARLLVNSWDPKQVQLVQALLEVVASGATVVLRPGQGGGSIGIAIWEGDFRHPPEWCSTSEELDFWAEGIILAVAQGEGSDKE